VPETGAPPAGDAPLADHHHLARGAIANTFVLLAANFRAIFVFLIARLLGEAALGRFALLVSTTELLSKVGMAGLDVGIVPLVAARGGDFASGRRVFLRAIAVVAVASTLVTAISIPSIVVLASVRNLDAFSGGAVIMLLALPAFAITRVSIGASRALLSMRNEFFSRGVTETWITIAVFVAAVALGARDAAPSLAVVGGMTASAIVAFVLAQRAFDRASLDATRLPADAALAVHEEPSPGRMLRFSTPIAGSSLLNVLVMHLDVLILGTYVGRAPGVTVETFGVFCAAKEIAGGMRKVRQIFDPIFAPVVAARAVSTERARLRETVAGPGRWVLSAQLPLLGALFLAGGLLLNIYGDTFRQGATWLAILAVAHAANSFAGLVETLIMVERPGLNVVNAAATVAIQAAAALVLIPSFGITGAALAALIGFGAQGALRFFEVRHVFGWSWPWTSLRRPVAAFTLAMAPSLAVRFMSSGTTAELVSGLLFLGLYGAGWLLLGADPDDRKIWARLRAGEPRASLDSPIALTENKK
jgi:O-antigen/teichoic acid export membrane protein